MDPQTYIETATDLQAARIREYFGRAFGLSLTSQAHPEYPIRPDTWPGMHNTPPTTPPADSLTLYYLDPVQKVGGGGVFVLDDDCVAFAPAAPLVLSDGAEFYLDMSTATRVFAQLSPEAQLALAPPPPPP